MINTFLNYSGRFFFRRQIKGSAEGNEKEIPYLNRNYKVGLEIAFGL